MYLKTSVMALLFVAMTSLSLQAQNISSLFTRRGAVTGAVIGGIIGGQNDEVAAGIIAGGLVGGVTGRVVGNRVEARNFQQQYYSQPRYYSQPQYYRPQYYGGGHRGCSGGW